MNTQFNNNANIILLSSQNKVTYLVTADVKKIYTFMSGWVHIQNTNIVRINIYENLFLGILCYLEILVWQCGAVRSYHSEDEQREVVLKVVSNINKVLLPLLYCPWVCPSVSWVQRLKQLKLQTSHLLYFRVILIKIIFEISYKVKVLYNKLFYSSKWSI